MEHTFTLEEHKKNFFLTQSDKLFKSFIVISIVTMLFSIVQNGLGWLLRLLDKNEVLPVYRSNTEILCDSIILISAVVMIFGCGLCIAIGLIKIFRSSKKESLTAYSSSLKSFKRLALCSLIISIICTLVGYFALSARFPIRSYYDDIYYGDDINFVFYKAYLFDRMQVYMISALIYIAIFILVYFLVKKGINKLNSAISGPSPDFSLGGVIFCGIVVFVISLILIYQNATDKLENIKYILQDRKIYGETSDSVFLFYPYYGGHFRSPDASPINSQLFFACVRFAIDIIAALLSTASMVLFCMCVPRITKAAKKIAHFHLFKHSPENSSNN